MNNITHLDIKPHNILIDPKTKKLKLIDFGAAEYYDPLKERRLNVIENTIIFLI